MKTSVILLAGGIGSRMKSEVPKQFIHLHNKPIALYSFELFASLRGVEEIIVVCSPNYQELFQESYQKIACHSSLKFALPGKRRQDSVFNGLQEVHPKANLVCIHDAARPLLTSKMVSDVLAAAHTHGAATIGVPVKYTIKECNKDCFVIRTPDRTHIWEIQTPQAMHLPLLREGFAFAAQHNLTVTDDASLIELIHRPVKLVEGCYSNIKITTKEDLYIAEALIKNFHEK